MRFLFRYGFVCYLISFVSLYIVLFRIVFWFMLQDLSRATYLGWLIVTLMFGYAFLFGLLLARFDQLTGADQILMERDRFIRLVLANGKFLIRKLWPIGAAIIATNREAHEIRRNWQGQLFR